MTKKNYMIIAGIIIVLVAGFVWWNSMEVAEGPTQDNVQPVDTTDTIQKDLDNIDVGDINAEFKDVDESLKSL